MHPHRVKDENSTTGRFSCSGTKNEKEADVFPDGMHDRRRGGFFADAAPFLSDYGKTSDSADPFPYLFRLFRGVDRVFVDERFFPAAA